MTAGREQGRCSAASTTGHGKRGERPEGKRRGCLRAMARWKRRDGEMEAAQRPKGKRRGVLLGSAHGE